MKAVLIGYGEVGKGVFGAIQDHHEIHIEDPKYGFVASPESYDIMLVAIPYSGSFVEIVKKYSLVHLPKAIVIFSSVPIGTCRMVGAVHSPIEGKHDNMVASIKVHTRWIAGHDPDGIVSQFFREVGLSIYVVKDPEITEFLKLASTTIYGINIEWARYCESMAEGIGFDFNLVKQYNRDYNFLVQRVHNNPGLVRYNLDPPGNEGIKGHCVLENAIMLREDFPSPLIDQMLALGKHPDVIQGSPHLNKTWLACEHIGKGRTCVDIGRQFGKTGENISAIMKRRGIKVNHKEWTDEQIEMLFFLADKLTFPQIAEKVGKTQCAVALKAIKMGIQSCYNPSEQDEETRKRISATLQGITREEWVEFKETTQSLIRKSCQYEQWRISVFERDEYTCQHCGGKCQEGQKVYLNAHHIKPFAKYTDLRFDIDNGITLCEDCHKKERNNTRQCLI